AIAPVCRGSAAEAWPGPLSLRSHPGAGILAPPRPATEGGPMKTSHVYTTPDLPAAQKVMAAARSAGVADDDILLVARSDIELDAVPDDRKEADSDMLPAAARGAGMGAGAGLLAGLVAVAIPPLGVTLVG